VPTRRLSEELDWSPLQVKLGWKLLKPETDQEASALTRLKQELCRQKIQVPSSFPYAADLDSTLLRFLRGRKLSVAKTASHLRDLVEWRQSAGANSILRTNLGAHKYSVIRKFSRGAHWGFDKEGRPVYFDRPGSLQVDKIISSGVSPDDYVAKHVQDMEYIANDMMYEASLVKGETVDQTLTIVDANGIKLTALTNVLLSTFQKLTKIDQEYYPDSNAITLVVNAGMIFSGAFRIVSQFLDARTRARIGVLGGGKAQFNKLKEYLELENMPEFCGGQLKHEVIWDENGLSRAHLKMDKEVARRMKLLDDGENPELADLPNFVREWAEAGPLTMISTEDAHRLGLATTMLSRTAVEELTRRYKTVHEIYGENGEVIPTKDPEWSQRQSEWSRRHSMAMSETDADALSVDMNGTNGAHPEAHPEAQQLDADMDDEVKDALEAAERIIRACVQLRKRNYYRQSFLQSPEHFEHN